MKIALAQIASIDGDVDANIERHLAALEQLRRGDAELAIFPELSLTNYEPAIAVEHAIAVDDARLAPLDEMARKLDLRICVGAPLRGDDKPSICSILISPDGPRQVIRKAYLHDDEIPFFAAGCERARVLPLACRVALAICFDISVDEHYQQAADAGMETYLASVAKTAPGIAAARERLRQKAREYRVPVLAVNSVGSCEGQPAGGNSLYFDADGRLIDALDEREQALLICDSSRVRARRVTLDLS